MKIAVLKNHLGGQICTKVWNILKNGVIAFNMALGAQSLRTSRDQLHALDAIRDAVLTEKWRKDENKIREMMDLGYSVVVPPEQRFYLPNGISTKMINIKEALRDKTKILIMKGTSIISSQCSTKNNFFDQK